MGSGSGDARRVRGTAEEEHTVRWSIDRESTAELRYGGLDGWEDEWSCEYRGTVCGGTEERRREEEKRVETRSTAVDSRSISVGKRSPMAYIKVVIDSRASAYPVNITAFYGLRFPEAFHAYDV